MRKLAFTLVVSIVAGGIAPAADPPEVIHYQGVLRDAADVPQDGAFSMSFRFFDDPVAGSWIVCDSQVVTVSGGLFSTTLGEQTNVEACMGTENAIPLTVAFADFTDLYLAVQVDGEVLSPRIRVAAAPYAMNSRLLRGRDVLTDGPLDLYVDAGSGDDANDGLSPTLAKKTIQAAMDDVPPVLTDNVEVHIATGLYNERVTISSRVRAGRVQWIRLIGDPLDPANVIIDGTLLPPPDNDGPESGIWVQDLPVEISGLTVRNFDRQGVAAEFGALLIVGSCRFEGNETGMRAGEGGTIDVADTLITANVTGIKAERSGKIRVGDGVHITDNTLLGVRSLHGSTVEFESGISCSLVNNDLDVSDHSSALNYGVCALTNSSCSAGDPSGRCVP